MGFTENIAFVIIVVIVVIALHDFDIFCFLQIDAARVNDVRNNSGVARLHFLVQLLGSEGCGGGSSGASDHSRHLLVDDGFDLRLLRTPEGGDDWGDDRFRIRRSRIAEGRRVDEVVVVIGVGGRSWVEGAIGVGLEEIQFGSRHRRRRDDGGGGVDGGGDGGRGNGRCGEESAVGRDGRDRGHGSRRKKRAVRCDRQLGMTEVLLRLMMMTDGLINVWLLLPMLIDLLLLLLMTEKPG